MKKREDDIYLALFRYTKALSAALGYRDQLTGLHSVRVLGLAEAIGVRCGLSVEELGILKIGASFHDIGKIGIPDSYDSMAVTRSYHRARTHQVIMEILANEAGRKHDPQLMRIFCEVIEFSQFKAAEI